MKTFKEFLDEYVKMGDTSGLSKYKSPECEFKGGDDVRIPVSYVTPYSNSGVQTAHTMAAKFHRQGEKFHHVDVNGEEIAVPKHHVFPANLGGSNYSGSKR